MPGDYPRRIAAKRFVEILDRALGPIRKKIGEPSSVVGVGVSRIEAEGRAEVEDRAVEVAHHGVGDTTAVVGFRVQPIGVDGRAEVADGRREIALPSVGETPHPQGGAPILRRQIGGGESHGRPDDGQLELASSQRSHGLLEHGHALRPGGERNQEHAPHHDEVVRPQRALLTSGRSHCYRAGYAATAFCSSTFFPIGVSARRK